MGMSGGNKASKEATKAEEARQAAIRNTQTAVNGVFDGPQRAGDIADFVGATRQFYTDDLNRSKADTDRELRFALARGGLIGGSTQVDQQKKFGEAYGRGLLDVERRAQGAGASVEAADQDARARLISLATSGLDVTTAAAQSAAAMRTNLQAGNSDRMAGSMADAFGGFKTFLDRTREAAERRRANQETGFGLYGSAQYGGG